MENGIEKSTDASDGTAHYFGWKGPGRYLFRAEGADGALSRRDCADERTFREALASAEAAAGGRVEAVKVRGHGPSVAERLPGAAAAWSVRNAFGPEEVGAWCDEPIWLVCDVCGQEWRTTPRAISRRPETQRTCTRCRKAEHAANACQKAAVVCVDNGMRFESVTDAARWLASTLPESPSTGYLRVLVSKGYQSGKPVKGYRFTRDEGK